MKIKVGDFIGLFNTISACRVEKIIGRCYLLDSGQLVELSDVYVVASDNEDGTITRTFWDGKQVTETLDEDYQTV